MGVDLGWIRYFFATSLFKQFFDWLEYRNVKKQIKIASTDVKDKYESLVRYFERDIDTSDCEACIKKQTMLGTPPRRIYDNQDRWKDCYVIVSRCVYFRPIGNEKLCPRTECKYFVKNKEYVNALNKVKELEKRKKEFWKNKTK